MPSVVLDASVLVSALLKDDSIPARALALARRHDVICVSPALIAELSSVLRRTKFRRYVSEEDALKFVGELANSAALIEPAEDIVACRDPKDDIYLELAIAAEAEVIVSSDADLLELDSWRRIRIVTPRRYVFDTEKRAEPGS